MAFRAVTRQREQQRPSNRRPSQRRLRIEPLEDRRLLTVVTVNTLGDTVVASDGLTSLREAIVATNLAGGADTIEFAASLTSGGPVTLTLTQGQLTITDSLTINGPGANLLTIDASGNDPTPDVNNGDGSRVFNFDDGTTNLQTVSISGLTLTGGDLGGYDYSNGNTNGGAIRNLEDLTVTDCTISGNAVIGYVSPGTGNDFSGGGIFNSGHLTVARSTTSGNTASGDGGGIKSANYYNGTYITHATLVVTASTLSNNSVGNAGGAISTDCELATLTDSTLSGNSAANMGGGIYSGGNSAWVLTVTNSTIRDNTAANIYPYGGGGIYTLMPITINNSTISGNSSKGRGGGVCSNSTVTVNNSAIVANQGATIGTNAYPAGGVSDTLRLILNHTIVAGNTLDNGSRKDLAGVCSATFSLIGDGTGATIINLGGNLIGTAASPIDPLLGPLADNGGPTLPDGSKMLTHALLPGSPAINAGDPSAVAGMGTVPLYDQRGNPFARVAGGRIDIGAFEVESTVVGRQLFYNNSFFDNPANAATFNDDTAIDFNKTALLPNNTRSHYTNYTTYDKGINGIMIDLTYGGNHGAIVASDFSFKVSGAGSGGASNDPSTWTTLATPPAITIRPGAGAAGSDRIELVWPDFTPQLTDTWLQVTIKSDTHTGLAADDHFYFGNMPGDTNNGTDPTFKFIDALDEFTLRTQSTMANSDLYFNSNLPTALANVWDANRDDQVDALDQFVVRSNSSFPHGELDMIRIPAAGPFAPTAVSSGDAGIASALAAQTAGDSDHRTVASSRTAAPRWDERPRDRPVDASNLQLFEATTSRFQSLLGNEQLSSDEWIIDDELLESLASDLTAR